VIAAYGRHLAACGGRDGRPAALATVRVYLSMIRALAHDVGLDDVGAVRIPRHEPGAPETITDTDYANLLRVPDRRTLAGKRNYALLRVLGDCGLRSAELRGLRARDLRRPRSNARHYRFYVRGLCRIRHRPRYAGALVMPSCAGIEKVLAACAVCGGASYSA
jgi:integrase